MPWINEIMCRGCGICVEHCPAHAILMKTTETAEINMDECIRCGDCHDICPEDAVRHDSEKIEEKVEGNMKTAHRLLEKCDVKKARLTCLEKYIKAIRLENKVNQKTIEKLEEMKKELD
jgi:ferredoxin